MKIRIAFGATMLAGVVGVLWLDWFLQQRGDGRYAGLPVAAGLLLVAIPAFRELARMAKALGMSLPGVSGMIGTICVAMFPFWRQWADAGLLGGLGGSPVLVLLGLIAMAIFLEQMIRFRTRDALRQIACAAMAVLYVGVGLSLILTIRMDFGVPALVLFLGAVKFTDIGAYFTGSAIGKHKLIPWLSPGKSWEGLAGGIVTAAGVSLLVTWALDIEVFGRVSAGGPWVWRALAYGAVVGAAGQFADLCESLLKRSAGVKDSGALVPEFGGMLDMIDSPLLASPVALILLNVLN